MREHIEMLWDAVQQRVHERMQDAAHRRIARRRRSTYIGVPSESARHRFAH